MKFWKRLRWLATAAFALVLVAAWLWAGPGNSAGGSSAPVPRVPPVFQ